MKTSPFMEELRAEGRTQGRVEARVEDILHLLKLRLKLDPPAEIRASIKNERNLDRLNRWLDAAATANSLDEFLAAFHQG